MQTRPPSLWQSVRPRLSYCKRQLLWLRVYLRTPRREMLKFRCNICGNRSSFPRDEIKREIWSCRHCASTVRWRSVIHALSMELFGKSLVIADFPSRPDLAGIGLSDWDGYANRLPAKMNYTNTYYHQEPRMDITNPGLIQRQYDFLISTEVFEHICPPISVAFENARKLLKPGGVMIFTVPYVQGETIEHFPDVRSFSVQREGDAWTLTGATADGTARTFTDLTFHGGPGTVVEFRLFGKDSLLRDCKAAGFHAVRVHDEAVQEFGILWNPYVAEDAPYRPLIHGLDTPPWALSTGPRNG